MPGQLLESILVLTLFVVYLALWTGKRIYQRRRSGVDQFSACATSK